MRATTTTAGITVVLAMALFAPATIAEDTDAAIRDENGCAAWNLRPQQGQTIRWSGLCKDGWLDGAGTIEWLMDGQPTEIVATTMRRGRASGFTRDQVLEQGVVVEIVEAEYADGRAQGYGQWRDVVNDVRYLGDFAHGRFSGLGTLFRADGSRLEGQFHEGQPRGFAAEFAAGGRAVLGVMTGDGFSGPGIVHSSGRARIETSFKNGAVPPGSPCRQFASNGVSHLGTVAAGSAKESISCKPSPGTNVAEFSRLATDAINAAAKAHGYSPKASPANPYAFIDQVMREQSAKIRAQEAEFAALAEKDAIPLPDDCLTDGTSDRGQVSAVVFQNRCDAPINVNVCVRLEGARTAKRLKQRAAPNGAARIEFANPHDADYHYEFAYCRPDRTQALDNCLAACPED